MQEDFKLTKVSSARLGYLTEAGTTFDNSFFDNSFVFLRQLKNGLFLGPVFVHVTGRSQKRDLLTVEVNQF